MSQWLKRNTAIFIQLGPFLDEDDGKTAEVGLAIAQADVRLSKEGAAFAQKNDANAAVHDEAGWYRCQLDATDTNTLGRLIVAVHESGALSVWREFMVITDNAWSSYCGADNLQVDAVLVEGGDATDAINAAVDVALNTAIPGAPTADSINQRIVAIDDLTQAAGGGDLAAILGDTNELQVDDTPAAIAALPTAAENADAVWDELVAGHDGAGKAGQQLWTDLDAILGDTNELQVDDTPAAIAALPTAIEAADAVLSRGVSNVEDAADTTSLAALVLAALESSVAGAVWTIRKTGGAAFVVKTVTLDAAADPIIGVT